MVIAWKPSLGKTLELSEEEEPTTLSRTWEAHRRVHFYHFRDVFLETPEAMRERDPEVVDT